MHIYIKTKSCFKRDFIFNLFILFSDFFFHDKVLKINNIELIFKLFLRNIHTKKAIKISNAKQI